ncbi:MAG: SDR family NAD(P)-dependent oxidoreductase, partial [Fibrobacter sp.]|nr:SDR family NAD(P)-dependent oxidoreductase [Fibrobacter sp.]
MSDKKQVLVTGASGGIGSAIAEAVAQAGYAVVAGYNRGKTRVDELIQRVQAAGGEIRGLQLDISDRDQCREVLTKDIEENGTYYGLI